LVTGVNGFIGSDLSDIRMIADEERVRAGKSEVFELWCYNSLIRSLTGFESAYSINKDLLVTIEWFTDPENQKRYEGGVYCV